MSLLVQGNRFKMTCWSEDCWNPWSVSLNRSCCPLRPSNAGWPEQTVPLEWSNLANETSEGSWMSQWTTRLYAAHSSSHETLTPAYSCEVPLQAHHLFFFCCRSIFLLFMIMLCSFSRPSCSPSPMMAQAGWRCHGVALLSSPSANMLSISDKLSEFLRSCLLATTRTGTPWFSASRVILCSSVLASSTRSASTESTTNTMPSAQRV